MTVDLFDDAPEILTLRIPEADVQYLRRVDLPATTELVLGRLIEETPWRAESVVLWGKKMPQPRLVAWYGDAGHTYRYSGITLTPLPWTPLLRQLREIVEKVVGVSFNSVLLNYYRNHRDSMGFHSDDEPELGRQPTIASLSLGAERTFVLKHKHRAEIGRVRLKLESGSLLIMKGDTQNNWKHGIDKEDKPCGPRVNLTFRRILVEPATS